jgi:hypothetical protein
MDVEAALPPPEIRLNSNIRQYALRALKLAPRHPIQQELSQIAELDDLPSPNPWRRVKPPQTQLEQIKYSI